MSLRHWISPPNIFYSCNRKSSHFSFHELAALSPRVHVCARAFPVRRTAAAVMVWQGGWEEDCGGGCCICNIKEINRNWEAGWHLRDFWRAQSCGYCARWGRRDESRDADTHQHHAVKEERTRTLGFERFFLLTFTFGTEHHMESSKQTFNYILSQEQILPLTPFLLQ